MTHPIAALAVPALCTEGKTKILTPGEQPNTLNVAFKNSATAFNGGKYAEFEGKGAVNAKISALLFGQLEQSGIPTCFIRKGTQDNELVYRSLAMIPLEIVVRNVAYGSVCKRFGIADGTAFKRPLLEFFLKNDALGDPQITEGMIDEMGLLPPGVTLSAIRQLALGCNEVLVNFFNARGIRCADYKLEMGLANYSGQPTGSSKPQLMLGDEMSPDNFRLRDIATGQVLDKDVFRLELADLMATYTDLLNRLEATRDSAVVDGKPLLPYTADVTVYCRQNVLHPESKAILEALHTMGHTTVRALRAGRRFELTLVASSLVEAQKQARQMTDNLLSNPVIEDAVVEVLPHWVAEGSAGV